MRKSPTKELGYIFVPIVIPPGQNAEHSLRHHDSDEGWKELGQILQALRAHDGRIEDELADLMDIYFPVQSKEPKDCFIVFQEPRRKVRYFIKTTHDNIENIVATAASSKSRSVVQQLQNTRGECKEIKNPSTLNRYAIPSECHAVRVKQDGITLFKGFSPRIEEVPGPETGSKKLHVWNPESTAQKGTELIEADKKGKTGVMKPPKRTHTRPTKNGTPVDYEYILGQSIVKLGGKGLQESGIHLNLLERSGILSGSKRDMNLLEVTVRSVANLLREEGLESTFAGHLNMTQLKKVDKDTADACTVTAVIWVNAAIMHARLDSIGMAALKNLPKLTIAVADPNPAKGIASAWQRVLTKDYVPIFDVANQLLMEVAFLQRVGVHEALSRMAKDSVEIADNYASLGMDHAGELFNKVMGNQRSDGAFFTRPVAASLLVELCLHATGETEWTEESTWERLRCFDPACGSGTLLIAFITAVKLRIEQSETGAAKALASRFHRKAVEDYILGADINPVSLQLAGCQITLGEVSALYDKINLYQMDYGYVSNSKLNIDSVRTGTPELLLDPRIIDLGNEQLDLDNPIDVGSQLSLSFAPDLAQHDDLVDRLARFPPRIIMMNPPYTPWRDCGEKFNTEVQVALRERMSGIWDYVSLNEPMLNVKKASVAPLFETLGIHLAKRSQGVFAMVRPLVFLTMTSARLQRAAIAEKVHIETILTCHHPENINMSWHTTINECLIVAKHKASSTDQPTRFVNLDTMPTKPEEAHEIIRSVMEDKPFGGSIVYWDYERMLKGDWSPVAFCDSELAILLRTSLEYSNNISYNMWGGAEHWKVSRFDI